MRAMIADLHSPRRKPQVNAIDQVFRHLQAATPGAKRAKTEAWSGTVASRRWVMWTSSKGHVSSTILVSRELLFTVTRLRNDGKDLVGRRRDVLTLEQPRGRGLRWCSVGPGSRPWRTGRGARGPGGEVEARAGPGSAPWLVHDRQQLAGGCPGRSARAGGRERLDGLGRVVAASVEAPIHHRLDAPAGRPRTAPPPRVAAAISQLGRPRPNPASRDQRSGRIAQPRTTASSPIDQGAVDDPVDLQQPIAQDGDADADRHQRKRHRQQQPQRPQEPPHRPGTAAGPAPPVGEPLQLLRSIPATVGTAPPARRWPRQLQRQTSPATPITSNSGLAAAGTPPDCAPDERLPATRLVRAARRC